MDNKIMKLIDKDALVAEINRIVDVLERNSGYGIFVENQKVICEKILSFLDTLEVKEVDLEKSISDWLFEGLPNDEEEIDYIKETAKHFFELGLKENQENNVIGILERVVKIDAGGYPYINCDIEFYDYDKDIPLAKEGDKVKVIIMKGE